VILVDISVWVDHLRAADPQLQTRLEAVLVLTHPFVVGEIALGTLRQRQVVLAALTNLTAATVATDAEVLHLIEHAGLAGRGIGYVDAHLLASAKLTGGVRLWTRDLRLRLAAEDLGLAALA